MKNILDAWLLNIDNETLQTALDSLHDSSLFRNNLNNPDIVAVNFDSTLQKQLLHLASCEWDRTVAALTWQE